VKFVDPIRIVGAVDADEVDAGMRQLAVPASERAVAPNVVLKRGITASLVD